MIIRMEPERVRLAALRLAKTAENIDIAASGLKIMLQSLDWEGPVRDEYVNDAVSLLRQLRAQAEAGNIISQRMKQEVNEWLSADQNGSDQFTEGRRSLGATPLIVAAGGGSAASAVLGASTTATMGPFTQEYTDMKWGDKFTEEARLKTEIANSQARLDGMRDEETIQIDINTIDSQIEELERQKAEAQAEAEKWYNQVLPDWPPQGDSDGLPWRVRADDFEDQVADYNRQIEALQVQKQTLQEEQFARSQEAARLVELQARQTTLAGVIDGGISPDGPTKPDWLRNQLAGCTNYVAQKRNVYNFPNASGQPGHPGHAQYWDNQARQAGYEVGRRPVVGSIMVFEADHGQNNGIMNVHNDAGHVAYVEKVEPVKDGYKVTISQANTKYVNGQYVRGTYIDQNTTTVTVKDGQKAASFIYDK